MIPFLFITLLCIGVVEGGYSILEYFLFRQPAEETVSPGTQVVKEGPAPSGAKRDYQIILTRNLFGSQQNTETSTPAPAMDVAALDKSDLEVVLVGTVDGSAGTHRAIIYDKKTRKQDLYKEGDQVKGASIKKILRGKVILDVEGKEELLDMSEAASVRPPVQAAPASQPRPIPQSVTPRGLVQPTRGGEFPAPGGTELAPAVEGAPETMQEGEPKMEDTPGEVAPDDVGPEAVPGGTPEAAAPTELPQPPQRKIVRPRVIRPYRSQ